VIDLSMLPIFLAGAIAVNLTPGPDMAFTLATSAGAGRKAGMAAVGGIAAGSVVWAGAAAIGIAALVAASEYALRALQIAGGLYLIWMAIRTAHNADAMPGAKGSPSSAIAFVRGLTTSLLNPKVGVFYLAFLPVFTSPDAGPVWIQTLILASIFITTGSLVLFGVALGAGWARDRLVRSLTMRRTVNWLAAGVFGAIGLRLLLSRPAA
jgi:threonine/homoserine/homoserine lactone efflux protein